MTVVHMTAWALAFGGHASGMFLYVANWQYFIKEFSLVLCECHSRWGEEF